MLPIPPASGEDTLEHYDSTEDDPPIKSIPTMTPEERRHAFALREQGIRDGSIRPNAFDPNNRKLIKPNPVDIED